MRVLVTGATGFVGQRLLPKLSAHEVKSVTRRVEPGIARTAQIVWEEREDETARAKFEAALAAFAPETVIHLAALWTAADDASSIRAMLKSNVEFAALLLESLKNAPPKLFINTGTFAEYTDGALSPAYFYAASKSAARPVIRYFKKIMNFKWVNVIPYTIYGGASRAKKVIDYVLGALESESPVEMTRGEQTLDFIHVDDAADFYRFCVEHSEVLEDGADYHLGTGRGTTVRELAAIIERAAGKRANIAWGKRPYRALDIMRAVAPRESLARVGWAPKITLEHGVKLLITPHSRH